MRIYKGDALWAAFDTEKTGITDGARLDVVSVNEYEGHYLIACVKPLHQVRVYRGVVDAPERLSSFCVFVGEGVDPGDVAQWNGFLRANDIVISKGRHVIPAVHGSIFRSMIGGGLGGRVDDHLAKCKWVVDQYLAWRKAGRPDGLPKRVRQMRRRSEGGDASHLDGGSPNGLVIPA